jgi:hypothetical protein
MQSQSLQVDRDLIHIKSRPLHEKSQTIIDQIQSAVPELNGDSIPSASYYRQIYKPYLKKTTASIGENSTVYKWNASSLSFQPHPLFPETTKEDIQQRAQDWNISIICFGKSITYMLKYVAYLFYDLTQRNRANRLHVSFLCDRDTADGYLNYPIEQTTDIREPIDVRLGFHRYMGLLKDQNREDPAYYPLDATELELLSQIHMYIIRSEHILCKGVGAKRALAQYLHAKFASQLATPDAFVCMTIDDNITGFYEMNNRSCTNRTPNKDMNPNCTFLSCLAIYDKLKAQMASRTHFLIGGVSKGNGPGATADHTVEDKDSYSIYKLIMTRSFTLWDKDLVYNPFFTRFMEDTIFNTEVGSFQNKRLIYMEEALPSHSIIKKSNSLTATSSNSIKKSNSIKRASPSPRIKGKGRGSTTTTQKKRPYTSARTGLVKNTTIKSALLKSTDLPSAFKMGNIRLTFGHIKKSPAEEARLSTLDSVCIGNIRDYDEYLPSYLAGKSIHVDGVPPIYAMYYLFLYAVYKAGHIRARIKTGLAISFFIFNPTTEGITLPLESKYGFLTFPLNLFLIAYTWNRPVSWSDGEIESVYDHLVQGMKTASYAKHLLVRWVNNQFLKKVAPLHFEFNEGMTDALQLGLDCVEEFKQIHQSPDTGETRANLKSLYSIRQNQVGNVCKSVRMYMKSKVDVANIVWMDSASASASATASATASINNGSNARTKAKQKHRITRMTRSRQR